MGKYYGSTPNLAPIFKGLAQESERRRDKKKASIEEERLSSAIDIYMSPQAVKESAQIASTTEDLEDYTKRVADPTVKKQVLDDIGHQNEATEKSAEKTAEDIVKGKSVEEALPEHIRTVQAEGGDAIGTANLLVRAEDDGGAAARLAAEKYIILKKGPKYLANLKKLYAPKEGLKPTTKIQNYEYAKSQGFEGSLMDYQKSGMGGSKAAPTNRTKSKKEYDEYIAGGGDPNDSYAKGLKRDFSGAGGSPDPLEKKMELYNRVVAERGEDDWYAKSIKKEIEGDPEVQLFNREQGLYHGMLQMYGQKADQAALGRGKTASANKSLIATSHSDIANLIAKIKRTGGLLPPEYAQAELAALNTIAEKSRRKGIRTGMGKLEQSLQGMRAFRENMKKQVARVKEIKEELFMFDSKLANVPRNMLLSHIVGSAAQKKYELYIREVSREMTKLANNSTQSIAAPTDAEREVWDKLHDLDLGFEDMFKLLLESTHAADMRVESMENEYIAAGDKLMLRDTQLNNEKKINTNTKFDRSLPIKSGSDPLGIR